MKRSCVAFACATASIGAAVLGAILLLNPQAYFSAKCLAKAVTGLGNYSYCTMLGNAVFNEGAVDINSFSVKFRKLDSPKFEKTASVQLGAEPYVIEQDGKVQPRTRRPIRLPADMFWENAGGLKQVFAFRDRTFGLVSRRKGTCIFASIVDLGSGESALDAGCLPDTGKIDFNGIGGGYTSYRDGLLLAIGAPEMVSDEIRALARDRDSYYGKIVFIRPGGNIADRELEISIFTTGHRNPQGMITLPSGRIYAVEQGPKGGDEINLIRQGLNYGWPDYSFGDTYRGIGLPIAGQDPRLERSRPYSHFFLQSQPAM